jgi:hypothetical protein
MTRQRDLKRRIRERQARTGESYVTARRHVVAGREASVPGDVRVVDLLDVSSLAASLGFRCRVAMFPELADRVEPAIALAALRDALVRTGGLVSAQLFGIAFGIPTAETAVRQPRRPPNRREFYVGLLEQFGSATHLNSMLVFRAAGRRGELPVVCMRWGPSLVLAADDFELEAELSTAGPPAPSRDVVFDLGTATRGPASGRAAIEAAIRVAEHRRQLAIALRDRATPVEIAVAAIRRTVPTLFLIYADRRYPVTTDQLVIGRDRKRADVVIRDGNVSRRHAAVVFRSGTYHLKDLGSTNGVHYKGMQIDNKRIDEGDVFQLGGHELRFTYRTDD